MRIVILSRALMTQTPTQFDLVWNSYVRTTPGKQTLLTRRGCYRTSPRRSANGLVYTDGVLCCMESYHCYVRRAPEGDLPPTVDDCEESGKSALYVVLVIDNDYNTYDEVINICSLALGIDSVEAYRIAWEIDHLGSCSVAKASFDEAGRIAEIIRSIGIEVEVKKA